MVFSAEPILHVHTCICAQPPDRPCAHSPAHDVTFNSLLLQHAGHDGGHACRPATLRLPPLADLTISCSSPAAGLFLHAYGAAEAALDVPADARLTVRGCRVSTLRSFEAAAEPYSPADLTAAVFGDSRGHITIKDSAMMIPRTVRYSPSG